MEKLAYLQQKKLNPTDELREILTTVEDRQIRIKSMTSTEALGLIQDLDQGFMLLAQLQGQGLNLDAEQSRFDSSQARIKQDVGHLMKALGGPDVLKDYRPSPPPASERWWWYADEVAYERRRRTIRQIIISVALVLAIFGGIVLLFSTILKPSPEAIARVEAENDANIAIETGDYAVALQALDKGLAIVPDDPGLMIYKGVLYQTLGDQAAADQSFAVAQAELHDSPVSFYLARSQIHLRVNQPRLAEEDARAALAHDENTARAWLILGQSLQLQGRQFEAIPALEKAGEVALETGENEIVVLARLALGNILGSNP